ncbi:MAG: hypothetical protein JRN57_04445 [Nitrososphaerota archaeon]|nr:hypothetical protein [Nitrososphaerota archaeon]
MVTARAYLFGKGVSQEEVRRRLASANPGSLVQVAREGAVDNEVLVEMLAAQTFRAEESGGMLAKKPEMDLLLRLAGTTQISRAIKTQGALAGEGFLAINANRRRISAPSEFSEAELPRKPLTEAELSRIERAALLNVQRA